MIDELSLRQGGVAANSLTKALQKLLKEIESAIRERLSDQPALEAQLRERHSAAVRAERTEGTAKGYNAFADEGITQAAVHWLLGCVFVRFLEDNGWLDERESKVAWIAGPAERLAIAKDRRTLFLRPDPNLTDRDYLLHVFSEISKLPGVAGLFDRKHNPLYSLQPTAQGAAKIVEFFQKTDTDTNTLIFDFTDRQHGTRFLGDLYQNLSESARKRYALCQTPGFVVDFILDRTLTPAIDTFGLATIRIIDPACGSGHFVLAALARIFRLWQAREPGTNPTALVQKALDSVYGVDLNPFAVEISRFRLLIAALESSGIERLKDAPNFRFNLAAGDSLLHGSRVGAGGIERGLFEDRLQFFYETEDSDELKRILGQQYQAVVGNPPYINVSDPILREAYRNRFRTCHGKYQLGVPFTERFFDLTVSSEDPAKEHAGWMGLIVSNAFMKRTFGKKLIEDYLRFRDLTHVIDTSGVYLPGHGTPTAILFARNQQPVASTIRAVRGVRGETSVPDDPANAVVWREIADHIDQPGFEGRHVSVADAPRASFAQHPWSIGGGGASELKELLDEASNNDLSDLSTSIGFASFPGLEDAFIISKTAKIRYKITDAVVKELVIGESVRDYFCDPKDALLAPYDQHYGLLPLSAEISEFLWTSRKSLKSIVSFGGRTVESLGQEWWGWYRWIPEKYRIPYSIAFGSVATHNHFTLLPPGRVFKQSAPVVKLSSTSDLDAHIGLLGLLNSSLCCFWLKQVTFPKGGDIVGQDGARIRKVLWDVYYDFDSTKLKKFPIPEQRPLELTKRIQSEADARSSILPDRLCSAEPPTTKLLADARIKADAHLRRMIALQEELDWQVYHLYGLLDRDHSLDAEVVPLVKLGERSFEILMARQMAAGQLDTTWFERHDSTPITELPAHWPEDYRQVVEKRVEIIQTNRDIALIEQPEHKRRWNLPTWDELEKAALKHWLLDGMEFNAIWKEHKLVSCASVRDVLARDEDWLAVAEVYNGGPVQDLGVLVSQLATSEAVPFLPSLRYTETGLRKNVEWEQVWELQRKEDAGYEAEIPVPPKYRSNDFRKSDYWRLRGSLDVPKERWISYPALDRDSDASPVLGWAGWSHLEQARALATYYQRMRTEEGWVSERLKPILAGLMDLRPWLKQWHNEVDPETGLNLGTYFAEFAEAQCQELGFSPEEVLAWKPAATTTRRRRNRQS